MKVWQAVALVGVIFTPGLSLAEQKPGWTNEVEFGLVATSGNTDEQTIKLRADSVVEREQTRHAVHFDALSSAKDDETTAERYYLTYQGDYKLDERQSVFGRVAYNDDKFSGFKYQADVTAGYSRLIFDNATMSLTGDAGAGMRFSELDDGTTNEEPIVRLAGAYKWAVSENATFQQRLNTEIGSDSTISRSETSLKANINSSLAMKLALNIKHNSDAPGGQKDTDTETSVTLVYGF